MIGWTELVAFALGAVLIRVNWSARRWWTLQNLEEPPGHYPPCRFCGGAVYCEDEACGADTHSHQHCGRVFRAGVERGQEMDA